MTIYEILKPYLKESGDTLSTLLEKRKRRTSRAVRDGVNSSWFERPLAHRLYEPASEDGFYIVDPGSDIRFHVDELKHYPLYF